MKQCLDPDFVRPPGSSYYSTNQSPFYFTLGIAEYLAGKYDAAYSHWLTSAEQNFNPFALVLHFDSMIVKHPGVAELYLARGLSHANQGPYDGWGKLSRQRFLDALKDFDMATELGMKDELVKPHRIEVLENLKKTGDK
jgi:hypothetical protein